MAPFAKVLWAIDPFDELSRHQVPLQALKFLAQATGAMIQPAYVVSIAGFSEGETDGALSTFSATQKVVSNLFKAIHHENLLPPRLVQATSSAPAQITGALLSYALIERADLIVANTHGWTGFRRLFQGNFVERLLIRSPLPVLALGPNVRETRFFDPILYATHLDARSKEGFRRAVEIARRFRSSLIVLGEDLPQSSQPLRRARVWSRWASRQGVPLEVIFEDTPLDLAVQIRRAAESERAGLILIEPWSGSLASLFKGNTVREIVRNARCPVWVERVSRAQDISSKPIGKAA